MMLKRANPQVARWCTYAIAVILVAALQALLPTHASALENQGSDTGQNAESEIDTSSHKTTILRHLLSDLVYAYEEPSRDADRNIYIDLLMTWIVSDRDYETASAIAENWKCVYADQGYPLYQYGGGDTAVELENAGIPDTKGHAFVVLGNRLQDGEMTDELRGRCDAALAASRSFPNSIIVCTGGATGDNNFEGNTEAALMKTYMVDERGLDEARVLVDESALSTVDNARNVLDMLVDRDIRTMTIVTSTYHQKRAQVVFNAAAVQKGLQLDWTVASVANYCYKGDSSQSDENMGDRIAARQIAQILELPEEEVDLLPPVID